MTLTRLQNSGVTHDHALSIQDHRMSVTEQSLQSSALSSSSFKLARIDHFCWKKKLFHMCWELDILLA